MIAIPFNAQTIKGKVTDEKNAPLTYANVVLQTVDSIYLAGTTTDMEVSSGAYGLDPNKVKLDKEDKSKPRPHKNYDFEETDYPHEPKFAWEE